MMAANGTNEEAVFHIAREIPNEEARVKYLQQICAGDMELMRRVEELLRVHNDEQDFLRSSPEPAPTVDQPPITERPGIAIGRYQLREQIGEGGMGIVFVAEQERPIQRKVALKVIKPGMDSKAVIARFDVERQALAMMDHPNIAKVLDAGTTESGRPYFVMELVRGVPITEYCDQNKLPIIERLELFTQVCHAIQHAHQKGIIHRDIKPTNVLVTLHDDKPVIKVIDFGVAKAISQRLTEQTVYTGIAQAIGTPLYMSPEQAGASGLDIDTRTDIYSLGVLLYELLTGTTPFDKKDFEEAAYEEVRRIIREREPAKPSTKISTLGATLQSVSAQRRTDPQRLSRSVRGDLDWIVMKSLEKDRQRRYETASSLSADIHRFLRGDVIEARPPSMVYRFRKAVARHWATFVVAAIVFLSLTVGIVTSLWFAESERQAKQVAESERKTAQETLEKLHNQLIEKAVLNALSGDANGAKDAITLAEEAGVDERTIRLLNGIAAFHRGDNRVATRYLESVLDEEADNVVARSVLALASAFTGEWDVYTRHMELITLTAGKEPQEDHNRLVFAYALAHFDTRRSMEIMEGIVKRHPTWAVARAILGGTMVHRAIELSDPELARSGLEETRLAFRLLRGNRVVTLYYLWANYAAIRSAKIEGQSFDELQRDAEDAVQTLNENFADYTAGAANTAWFYETIGDLDAAAEVWAAAVGDTDHGDWTYSYAALLVTAGRYQDALKMLENVRELRTVSTRTAKAYLLATSPDGQEEAKRLAIELIGEGESLNACLHGIAILCLLGERERVITESRMIAERGYPETPLWKSLAVVRFHAQQLSVESFEEVCNDSGIGRIVFHFNMAFRAISEGNRELARGHFGECTAIGYPSYGVYHWSKAFCQLLDDNPNWIPSAAGGESSTQSK
jgi:serine/threonine protein kinase